MRYLLPFIALLPLSLMAAEPPNQKTIRDLGGQIYAAIRSEDVERVKSNLAINTNAANYVGEKNWTLLHFAAEYGSSNGTQIVKLLLANGAKIEAKNIIGQTPLFSAVNHNNPEGAKILIAHGAKVNIRQDGGGTPLHWAALNGYRDIAELLINNKAVLNAKNSDGKTPLGLALEQQERSRKDGDADSFKRYQETIALLREIDMQK